MGKFVDLTGKKFGRLTVIKRSEKKEGAAILWECCCDCGNPDPVYVTTSRLNSGNTKSCGCLQKENNLAAKEKCRQQFKKYNKFDLSGEYGICYTAKGEAILFDKEDYSKIKDICWSVDAHGYVQGRYNGKVIKLHKFLFDYQYYRIDHENRNPLDNRKKNLRPCTIQENNINRGLINGAIRKSKYGVIGIRQYKDNNKWAAYLGLNYKTIYLGQFDSKDEAIKARLEAEAKYFGEFAPQKHLFEQYGIKEKDA